MLVIVLLEQRLLRCFQLRPFDVGDDGDRFLRAVSQLYGDPEHHLQVRADGIEYMRGD